jgi:hypothetical protein
MVGLRRASFLAITVRVAAKLGRRQWKANVVGTAAVTAGLDEYYPYDALNRLT